MKDTNTEHCRICEQKPRVSKNLLCSFIVDEFNSEIKTTQ